MSYTHRVCISSVDGLEKLRAALLDSDGGAAMAQIWFYDNGDVLLECGVGSERTAAKILKATNKRKAILWPPQEKIR